MQKRILLLNLITIFQFLIDSFIYLFIYLRNIYWALLRDQIPGGSDLSDSVVAFKSSHNRGSENNKEQTCVKCKLEKNRNNLFLCKHYLAKIYFKQKRTVCQIGKERKSSLSRKKTSLDQCDHKMWEIEAMGPDLNVSCVAPECKVIGGQEGLEVSALG